MLYSAIFLAGLVFLGSCLVVFSSVLDVYLPVFLWQDQECRSLEDGVYLYFLVYLEGEKR
jgi:hypothetical protein